MRLFIAVFFFACVFSYVFIIIVVVLNIMGIIFLRGGVCNNNNLRNIHIIIPCRRSFSVLVIISGISPYTNLRLCILFSKNFIGSYFLYSPRRQAFLIDFICVFIGCSLGSSFRYSPVFKPFLVNF